MPRTTSIYEPAWARLKIDGILIFKLEFEDDDTREQKEAKFKRFRKAISTRKNNDHEFYADNPTARIIVTSKNYETGKFVFEIQHLAKIVTLHDLTKM